MWSSRCVRGLPAKHAKQILAAIASPIRPKWVIAVDSDINIHNPAEVEWAKCFRVRPDRDVFVIDQIPAGPLDPSVSDNVPLAARTSAAVGIDATIPFGEPFAEAADVPGWQDYFVPELDKIVFALHRDIERHVAISIFANLNGILLRHSARCLDTLKSIA